MHDVTGTNKPVCCIRYQSLSTPDTENVSQINNSVVIRGLINTQ